MSATSGLVVRESDPFNAETPLPALAATPTPTPLFYVRNHFDVPRLDASSWRLRLDGLVDHAVELSLAELQGLAPRSVAVTLECAGNGRALARPLPPGTPWVHGAVSTATFTGAPLPAVLGRAGVRDGAVEALFRGADRGRVSDGRSVAFERSLPVSDALSPGVLLAWEMNGEPLAPEHGAPVRAVVPGWYGVASVKWLTRISLVGEPFRGYFQTDRYVYRGERGTPDGAPVSRMRVRALIASPEEGARLSLATFEISGTAWSGTAPVVRVEVSADGGVSWSDAELGRAESPWAARAWRRRWTPPRPGAYTLLARATDAARNSQPLEAVWNELGYGNHGVQRVSIDVAAA